MVKKGKEFICEKPEKVIDFLKSRHIQKIKTSPSKLRVNNSNDNLTLMFTNGVVKEYPIRKSFLHKLLGWYQFPILHLKNLSADTIASICNDYLNKIKGSEVFLKIENDEALTIISKSYNEIEDLTIINSVSNLGIKYISRNDFFMSINTIDEYKITPVPGDDFGIGLNMLNSETGFRALTVKQFILRYICTNGAYTRVLDSLDYKRYHYGNDNLYQFVKDKVEAAKKQRIDLKDKFEALKTNIDDDFFQKIEKEISKLFGNEKAKHFLKEFDRSASVYDLFNYITANAKSFDFSQRYFLESLAGDMFLNYQHSKN